MNLSSLESSFASLSRKIYVPLSRIALFVVFFWFGILKVFGTSPANPLVSNLLAKTLPFISFGTFIVLFGLFEMLIGLLFIIPKMEKVVIPLFFLHMTTTIMPLFLLPSMAWSSVMTPTLEGQYIIKNLALIACVFSIASKK